MVVDGGAEVNDVWEGARVQGGFAGFSGMGWWGGSDVGVASGNERTGGRSKLAFNLSNVEARGVGAEPCDS